MKKLASLATILVLVAAPLAEAQQRPPGQSGNRPPSGGQPGARPPGGGGQPGTRPPSPGQPGTRPPSGGNPGTRPPSPGQPGVRPPGNRPPSVRPPAGRPPSARPPHRPGTGRPPNFRPVHRPPFRYPHGYRYQRWGIGGLLPLIFISNTYYYSDWYGLGLGAPPSGYRWVRYGPDLLLVNVRTRRIVDVIYGAFY